MDISFNGKRALVTGAGRGIGREIVSRLVAGGAQVVALSLTQANLTTLKQEFPSVETHCIDLSDWDKTEFLVKSLGPIDLLVNNAAIALLRDITQELITREEFDRTMAVNVRAAICVSQIVAQGMKQRGTSGAIVNISSQASIAALKGETVNLMSMFFIDLYKLFQIIYVTVRQKQHWTW